MRTGSHFRQALVDPAMSSRNAAVRTHGGLDQMTTAPSDATLAATSHPAVRRRRMGRIIMSSGMARRALIIAIDGPSGAGKGTVARAIAARLRYRYVDSGAMYRAVAWKARESGLSISGRDAAAVANPGRAPDD